MNKKDIAKGLKIVGVAAGSIVAAQTATAGWVLPAAATFIVGGVGTIASWAVGATLGYVTLPIAGGVASLFYSAAVDRNNIGRNFADTIEEIGRVIKKEFPVVIVAGAFGVFANKAEKIAKVTNETYDPVHKATWEIPVQTVKDAFKTNYKDMPPKSEIYLDTVKNNNLFIVE